MPLSHPLVQTIAIPIVLAFVVAGLLRLVAGHERGRGLAAVGVGLGMLAAYGATFGIPDFPPVGSTNKLFYVVVVALAVGLLCDVARWPVTANGTLAALAARGGGLWIGGAKVLDEPWPWGLVVVIVVAVGAGAAWRLARHRENPTEGGVMVLVAAIAISGAAFLANTASSAQLAGATAAALGGFLLWNWPKARFPLGGGALLPAMALLTALAVQMVLFTRIEAYALVPLALVFVADHGARRLSLGAGAVAQALRPVVLALIAAVPAAAAVALVYLTLPQSSGGS